LGSRPTPTILKSYNYILYLILIPIFGTELAERIMIQINAPLTPPYVKERQMDEYECPCGYVYNPDEGDVETMIPDGTAFEDLADDWVCPKCGAEKEYFEKLD
jgi:rubredoxin